MDKQMIEEMARIIAFELCPNRAIHKKWGEEAQCYSDNNFAECKEIKNVVDKLYNAGYRKIPENAVVLMGQDLELVCNIAGIISPSSGKPVAQAILDKERKETAEKLLERVKELEEALLDMVVQFCQMVYEGELRHTFMSAEENAFDVLDIDYGEKVDDVYERFNKKWGRPIDEILKEITGG